MVTLSDAHVRQIIALLAKIAASEVVGAVHRRGDYACSTMNAAVSSPGASGTAATGIIVQIADWIQSRERLQRDPKAERTNAAALRRFALASGARSVGDITTKNIEKYLSGLSAAGKSASLVNNHLAAISQFCKWAQRLELITSDPTLTVLRAEADKGDGNAAFSPEQAAAVARAAPDWRQRVYVVAWSTGLRRKELSKLQKSNCLDLRTGDARIELLRKAERKKTKSRRATVLPLRPEVAAMLDEMLRGKSGPDLVFEKIPHHRQVCRDIVRAGWVMHTVPGADGPIPVDEYGAPYGMHSFRKGFDTALVESGVELPMLMTLMRHSDPRLSTKVYNRARVRQMAKAVAQVPGIGGVMETTPKNLTETNAGGLDKPKDECQTDTTERGPEPQAHHDSTCRPQSASAPSDLSGPRAQCGLGSSGLTRDLTPNTGIAGVGFEPTPNTPGSGPPVLGVIRIELVVRLSPESLNGPRSNPTGSAG